MVQVTRTTASPQKFQTKSPVGAGVTAEGRRRLSHSSRGRDGTAGNVAVHDLESNERAVGEPRYVLNPLPRSVMVKETELMACLGINSGTAQVRGDADHGELS